MATHPPNLFWQRFQFGQQHASLLPQSGKKKGLSRFRLPVLSWAILAASLCFTLLAWHYSNKYYRERAADRLAFRAEQIKGAVIRRMLSYEQVLRGGVGLWMASSDVSREEWRIYAQNAQLGEYYPGIQGFGFSLLVRRDQLAEHTAQVRAEGFPEYRIFPDHEREFYHSILYLEPFDWRNQRAFGFDMYTEPTRRAAMDRAIGTGLASLSARVVLVQETEADVQPGFLLYLPLYRPGMPLNSPEQRRQAFYGMVYAPFRTHDLMKGLLDSELEQMALAIYDGEALDPNMLLFSTASEYDQSPEWIEAKSEFRAQLPIQLSGHRWTMELSSLPGFLDFDDQFPAILVASAGLLVDVLLFFILVNFARQRQRALGLAQRMNHELLEQEALFRTMVEVSPHALLMLDRDGLIELANSAAEQLFGYRREELIGRSVACLMLPAMRDQHQQVLERVLQASDSQLISGDNICGLHQNGSAIALEVGLTPVRMAEDTHILATLTDIRERKLAEEASTRYTAELERSNKELDSFAYVASHDLKSPLRGISQLAEWIEEDLGPDISDQVRSHLDLIRNRIQRLTLTLEGLHSYFRAGRRDHQQVRVDTGALARECFEMAAPSPGFKLAFTSAMPVLHTCKAPLELVLRNLISNAIKHHDRDQGCINIGAEELTRGYLFSVADDGPGVPPQYHERIFGMFQTLRSRDEFESSGMGLALVKKEVEAVGGNISLVSEGRGASFRFFWPAAITKARPAFIPNYDKTLGGLGE